jgi:hypothetical protein
MTNLTLKHLALSPHGVSHAAYGSKKGEYCPKKLQSTGLFIIEKLRFSCDLGTKFLSLIEIKFALQKFNSHSFLLSLF